MITSGFNPLVYTEGWREKDREREGGGEGIGGMKGGEIERKAEHVTDGKHA